MAIPSSELSRRHRRDAGGAGRCRFRLAWLSQIARAFAGDNEEAANAHHRFLRAEGYEYLGYTYEALAAAPPAAPGQKREHMATARDMFRQSMDVLDKLRARCPGYGERRMG